MLFRNLAIAAFAFSSPTTAQVVKQPTGPWVVHVAANQCLLIHPYGSPTNPLYLAVSKAPMSDGSEVTILYKRGSSELRQGKATISFDGRPSIEVDYSALLLVNRSRALEVATLRSVTMSQDTENPEPLARDAKTVSIAVPKELSAMFALPDQGVALEQLNSCAMKLGAEWGYSLEEQRRLARHSTHPGGLGRLFSAHDYPKDAHWRGEMGRVRVRIRISDAGKPIDCTTLNSSGSESLDNATCDIILKRSKFRPALDVDGKNVRSVHTATVNWLLTG